MKPRSFLRRPLSIPVVLFFVACITTGCSGHAFRHALPVDDESFRREVLEAARPVLVLFHDEGSSSGRAAYGPVVDALAASGSDLVKVRRYPVGADSAFHEKYGFEIRDLPVLFDRGRPLRSYGKPVSDPSRARAALAWTLAPLVHPPRGTGYGRPAMLVEENFRELVAENSMPAAVLFDPAPSTRKAFADMASRWSDVLRFLWCGDPVLRKRYRAGANEIVLFQGGREIGRYEAIAHDYAPADEVDLLERALPVLDGMGVPAPLRGEEEPRRLPLGVEDMEERLALFAKEDAPSAARLEALRDLDGRLDGVLSGRLVSLLAARMQAGRFPLRLPPAVRDETAPLRFEERLDQHFGREPDLAALTLLLRSSPARDLSLLRPLLAGGNPLAQTVLARGLVLGNWPDEAISALLPGYTRSPHAPLRFVAFRGLARRAPRPANWFLFLDALRSGDRRLAEGVALGLEEWAGPELADLLAAPPADLRPELARRLVRASELARARHVPWSTYGALLLLTLLVASGVAIAPRIHRNRRRQTALHEALELLRRDDYDRGLAALYRYVNEWLDDLDRAWLWLSVAHLKRNELTAALDALGHVHLPASSPVEIYELATQLEARELDDQAIKLLRHLVEERGGHADAAERLARLTTAPEVAVDPDRSVAGIVALLQRELPDRYGSIRHLCWGGMACVFTAQDGRTGEKVAIKVLDPRFEHDDAIVRRFYREAVAVSNLDHPNIPGIRSVRRAELPFYVMEFVDGENLDLLLSREGRLETRRALVLGRQIAAALAQAHGTGIVHRDVKPANVLVGRDGRARLVDFGIARFDATTGVTATGQILGTPRFMSPEQLKGERVGPPTDVYSFGVTLYLCLSGRFPFPSESPYERIFKDCLPLRDRFETDVPGLCELVDACLDRLPERRPRDGQALVDALVSIPF